MCALQPRQLFARALLMPRLTSSPLNVSYAHLSMQPAAFASPPSSVTRQRRHPVWGTAGGCAGIFWGAVGMRERMGSAPRALPWRARRCSVVGRLAGWYLRGSGGVWGLQGGAGGSSLSCGMNPSLTAPRGSHRDARAAVAQVAQTRVPQSRQIPAPSCAEDQLDPAAVSTQHIPVCCFSWETPSHSRANPRGATVLMPREAVAHLGVCRGLWAP